jgi:hypothetical protein
MSKVINLATFRIKSRKAYLDKHGGRIDRLVERFVRANIDVDFRQLAEDYQAGRYGGDQACWDYVQFREVLAEALDAAFGKALYAMLMTQPWFDDRFITQEEVVDRCLSTYVLSRCEYALLP